MPSLRQVRPRDPFPDLVARYLEPETVKRVTETIAVIDPGSVPAAKAVLSTGEQDRYWEYTPRCFF